MTAPARHDRPTRLLTHDEAAAHLHVCPRTLRSIRAKGLIPYVAVTARRILYRIEDLDAFVAARLRTEVAAPTGRRGGGPLSKRANVVSFTARRQERLAARGR